MSNPPVPWSQNVVEITTPYLLGVLWNWTLYGVLVVQTYVYSYNFPGDRTLLKLLAAPPMYSVFLVETAQTALTGADLYDWFAPGFFDMGFHQTDFDVPIIGSIVSLIVQLFFVYRIWLLSERSSWFPCLIICLCSIVGAVAAFYGGVYAYVHDNHMSRQALHIPLLIWMSGNALADVLIACSIFFHLRRRRNEGDGQFSEHALSRIVRLTIETNVLTSTVGIIVFLMLAIFPDKSWFACPLAILGKLYSNTLLVSLNNRISIREGRGAVVRSPPLTLAFTPNEPGSEIVNVEFEKSSAALVAGSSEDCTGRGAIGVIDICITRDQVVV
ncbi:hypothetical protein EDB83DRAFT_2519175 [Lactarius deliciosus]|nr:hypothetical protein EDB83DRAFT_2519175 [Lactarius deliciosus]